MQCIHELNRLGLLVDLSHVSPATMHAALDATSAPITFSHSSYRALADHPRNVPDDARGVAGSAHIDLRGDFDGTGEFPEGLEGVDGYPPAARGARRPWLERRASRGLVSPHLHRAAR